MSDKEVLKEGNTRGNVKPSSDRDGGLRPSAPPPPPKPKNKN